MTDKLFNQETPEKTADQATQQPPTEDKDVDPTKPLFKVGDREYNAEAAAKDIAHKQAFIDQLLNEKRELEAKMADLHGRAQKADAVDARLQEALDQLKQQQVRHYDSEDDDKIPSQETETVDRQALEDQLRKIAEETSQSTIQSLRQQETRQKNLSRSIEAAKEALGDDYETKLREKGKALDLTEEQIQGLAEENPNLFIETFARKPKVEPQVPQGRNSYSYRKPQETDLPRITGYWHRDQSVSKLREAEQAILRGLQDGTYKPKTF